MTNELYEFALSEDGTVYGPFESFVPGDVRLLDNFVKFRVTVFGDFAEEDYRLRGFSGIVDDATTSSGGFGVSPFGRFPFGDGGICLEDSEKELEGELHLSGTLLASSNSFFGEIALSGDLSIVVDANFSGSVSLSGDLQATVASALTGSMSLDGNVQLVVPGGVVMFHASGNAGTTINTSNNFLPLGSTANAVSTLSSAQSRLPSNIVITALFVQLRSALTGGGTLTIAINSGASVGSGSTAGAPSVTITSGGSSGNVQGQSFAVSQDDFLAFQANFAGGSTSATIQAISFAYRLG